MDFNSIKNATANCISGGQYLPADKIGFASLPKSSANFDAHFGEGTFDSLSDLLYSGNDGYVTVLAAWVTSNIDQINDVLKMLDLIVSSRTAIESLVAGGDLQNSAAFPRALHDLCSKTDAFHAGLQAMPARNPRFESGSDVLGFLESFKNEPLIKEILLPKWSNVVESFGKASNDRFLLERELEVRRWQTMRNARCTDMDAFHPLEAWRKGDGGRHTSGEELSWWPGTKYTPKYLYENHKSKPISFDWMLNRNWIQFCPPCRFSNEYLRRTEAAAGDHPPAIVNEGSVEVKSDKGVVQGRDAHMDYFFVVLIAISKALIKAWPKEVEMREQADAVNRVMAPLTRWMTAVERLLTELQSIQKELIMEGMSLYQNLDDALKDSRGNLAAGELDCYRADCEEIVELLNQLSLKSQGWKSRVVAVPEPSISGIIKHNDGGSKPEKNAWLLNGLSRIDLDHNENCRIRIIIDADGAPIPETWATTKLYSAWTSWMSFPRSIYSKVAKGTVGTSGSPGLCEEFNVKFERPFKNVPVVTSWLTAIDTQAYKRTAVWVSETAITREGCTIRISRHESTQVHGIQASWLAYDPTETNIYTGLHHSKNSAYGPAFDEDEDSKNFQTGAFLDLRTDQPGRYISWNKNFTAPPVTMVGLRRIDFDTLVPDRDKLVDLLGHGAPQPMWVNYRKTAPNHRSSKANIRLHADMTMTTKDGGILELYSWWDSFAWPNEVVVIAAL